jgi:hypothetical protein
MYANRFEGGKKRFLSLTKKGSGKYELCQWHRLTAKSLFAGAHEVRERSCGVLLSVEKDRAI